jgi:hypothetical protein
MPPNDEDGRGIMRGLKLTDIFIAAPVFHLVCAGLFLVGYCWFFGAKIASFVGPSDIFAVSVGDVGQIYVFSVVPLALYLLIGRAASGGWTSAEAVALKPEGSQRYAAWRRHESNKRFYKFMFLLLAIGQITGMVISYLRWGYIPVSLLQTLVVIGFALLNVWLANRSRFTSISYNVHHWRSSNNFLPLRYVTRADRT